MKLREKNSLKIINLLFSRNHRGTVSQNFKGAAVIIGKYLGRLKWSKNLSPGVVEGNAGSGTK